MASTQHEISELRCELGELSFHARVGGAEKRIWFRSESAIEPGVEAALAAALMPAMRSGGTLTMSEPISPRVLRTQREFQGIQRAWSLGWEFGDPPLCEVEVQAPTREPQRRPLTGRVAAFFSGGVDSWATVLGEPDLTDLIFVRGIDILENNQGEEFADRVEARLRAAAAELGLPLHVVATNLRELSEPFGPAEPLARWETFYGCAMAAVALFLGRSFDRILIAGDSDYEVQVTFGANWMVDQLWSTEDLEIVDDGGRFSRVQRTERIASHPTVRKSLRVCWQNPGGAYNCGHCRKCLMTMAALEAFDALEAVQTFPSQIDLEELRSTKLLQRVSLHLWEDVLDALREADKPELEEAVEVVVAGAKLELGLPPGYRRRSAPPPVPRAADPRAGGRLLATPATARALAAAEAVAFLVGSYDGSGNFGDIAQLDGALGLLGELEPGLLSLPVVERQYAQTHEQMRDELRHPPRHVLYFDDGRAELDDGLVPVSPDGAGFALVYLYGGGFLNPSWGERKLAMLRAVEGLAQAAAKVTRIASGQQVDPGWITGLGDADASLLASFELLGARDDASARALEQLQGGAAPNTGDDAVGLLATIAEGAGTDAPEDVVNVHVAEHEWVTDDPDGVRAFDAGLIAGLSQAVGRQLRVRPLLAYLDPRVDERPGLERFAAACAEGGISVEEPILLRPAGIAADALELSRSLLTVSSSYHVALTSLLLGVPTVILRDNPYYDQKARGLLADFDLPAEFSPRSSDDPGRSAEAIGARLVADGEKTRARLREAAARVKHRRDEAEAALVARIARGAMAGGGTGGSPPAEAQLQPLEERLAAAEQRAVEAEHRTQEAERRAADAEAKLQEVLGSSSWRVTAPLRRLAARLRDR
jgi:polysaccharide pyruvyl transferase WcaK-like protein